MLSLSLHFFLRRVLLGLGHLLVLIVAFALIALGWAAVTRCGRADYVALGSSFAAGPGIDARASGGYFWCMNSDENYAHLLAEEAALNLRDVTCSGATTEDVLRGGVFFQPPQVEAVTRDTKLVTITVGGNDVSYLGNLGAWACANAPSKVPGSARWIGVCHERNDSKVNEAFATLPNQMMNIVRDVRRRAPTARIIFVDYTTVLPKTGTCDAVHLSGFEAEKGRQIAARLAAVTAQVAHATNSELIQASVITRGHDVCSVQPWVYGLQFPKRFLSFGPAPFHPRVEAMRAIADSLRERLRTTPPFGREASLRNGNSLVKREESQLTLNGKP